MIIDAHQHFWNPARGDYGWMPADDPVLSRSYGPADLAGALKSAGVHKTVLVQAAPSTAETEYMLGIADATEHVAAVVGWIDFEDPDQFAVLERLAGHPKFAGVRPMIQDIADDGWMLRDDVQWAFRAVAGLGLTFDALGFPRHLDNFHTILTRYPQMRAVVDHCLKPQLSQHSEDRFSLWARGMERIARDTSACCKLSGLVTEAAGMPVESLLRRYTDHVLGAFGPDRVMWGSDWPVVRLRCEYGQWFDLSRRLTDHLGEDERAMVFGGTAARFYWIEGRQAG